MSATWAVSWTRVKIRSKKRRAGLQTGIASDIIYEHNPYGAVTSGFSSVVFPTSDPTQWLVN